MKKNIFEIALLFGLVFSLLTAALASETRDGISEKVIRLHVIANSDSKADQELKLKVRDEVLKHMEKLTKGCTGINEARKVISENIVLLKSAADAVCKESNFTYISDVRLEESDFPTKDYDTFSLPAGKYEALKITLGKGNGQNWWCVLFPPLCVSAAECEFDSLELDSDEIAFITSDSIEYKFQFKLLEIIEKFRISAEQNILGRSFRL